MGVKFSQFQLCPNFEWLSAVIGGEGLVGEWNAENSQDVWEEPEKDLLIVSGGNAAEERAHLVEQVPVPPADPAVEPVHDVIERPRRQRPRRRVSFARDEELVIEFRFREVAINAEDVILVMEERPRPPPDVEQAAIPYAALRVIAPANQNLELAFPG